MSRPDLMRVPAHLAEHEEDRQAVQRGYIKATDYALPYFSGFSRLHADDVESGLLRHVNCNYLSTFGAAPTLLALKQHAQALCILIHKLSPTLESGEIAAGGKPKSQPKSGEEQPEEEDIDPLAVRYQLNDAFDFLDDLTRPYENDDPSHHRPLLALINEVRARDEAQGITHYHCPLATAEAPRAPGEKIRPYSSHHNLVMHANACLERLDHEFSPTGGLMSLLPVLNKAETEGDAQDLDPNLQHPDLVNARNSLLGQWLHFTQALVARMHDLERAYGAALDLMAGEATIPHEYLSSSTASPVTNNDGRPLIYPQDRWVLAHANDAVFELVHSLLDRQEAIARGRERAFARNGAVSDGAGFADRGGLVYVDIKTRYYRVSPPGNNNNARNRSTIFVLPAWEQHPGVVQTRIADGQPTIIALPKPKWPARATELEQRYRQQLQRAQKTEMEDARLRVEAAQANSELRFLTAELERLAASRDALLYAIGDDQLLADPAARVHEVRQAARKAEKEAARLKRERDEATAREEALRQELDQMRTHLARWEDYYDKRDKRQAMATAFRGRGKAPAVGDNDGAEGQ
ncbi:hypothetical protein VTJ04DRAFT_5468 [Mycothermus thermophilus]|uniref:uncharacterized protein n=1 Tax=Humicola insolens TaxID=85995 RepID=UPI00374318FF